MLLAVQYYRPPFPRPDAWADDMKRIADAGIEAVQLWITWGWVESEPSVFNFNDYDQITAAARAHGLSVVLSTIAECQPFWMHRLVPDSRMVNHLGLPVMSTTRRENNVGVTPGGCWDNPEVLRRLGDFLTACGEHFRDDPALLAWDVWNETRWAVHADAHVCYCPHTLAKFRRWLDERHGGLDGLNEAWRRRYTCWDDVDPGRTPGRMYTESMEFQRFLTWRAGEHMRFRADRIRAADAAHPVGGHCVGPSTHSPGARHEQALSRGNDWDHVAGLDSYGLSMYPDYFIDDAADFGGRIAAVRSAAGDRDVWMSELEAAPVSTGFSVARPVSGADVRRWILSSVAHGATAAVLWQWYDEFVGPEAMAFGLAGHDGDADDRLAAVSAVAQDLRLISGYRPDPGQVAVLFDESSYYLDWAEYGSAAEIIHGSVSGYIRALEWTGVPYRVLHARHLTQQLLDGIRLVIAPAPFAVAPAAADVLTRWVAAGGTLLAESDLDAWNEEGIYRYPGRRPLAAALGVAGHGHRPTGDARIEVATATRVHQIAAARWIEPVGPVGEPPTGTSCRVPHGDGAVIAVGTLAGLAYHGSRYREFEEFIADVAADADALGSGAVVEASARVLVRGGSAEGGWLIFVTNPSGEPGWATLRLPAPSDNPKTVIGRAQLRVTDQHVRVEVPAGEVAVVRIGTR
jgi:beta-galactosidase